MTLVMGPFCYNLYMSTAASVQAKVLPTLEALQAEAASFISELTPAGMGATLVTLSGELGAGKTSFAQGVARALGVTAHVTSPTFVLEKVYELPLPAPSGNRGFSRLVHIDAYRLEEGAALAPLGFDELMRDPANLVLLEWPERVADALPEAACAISLAVAPGGGRTIAYTYA